VFSLGGWSPLLPTNSPGFVVLRIPTSLAQLACTGLSPATVVPSNTFQSAMPALRLVLQPHAFVRTKPWFGLLPPRSPLLRESRLISLRRATEMFQFAHCPPLCLWVQQRVSRHHSRRVAPFGVSGLIACMQLPLNVSPVSASFFGFQRQGIHLVLCVACYFFTYSHFLRHCFLI
jgi:hypothetical protein